MQFEKEYLYHLYNQGNNRQKIFFERENYLFFLKKVRKHILPYCNILAYCLMPNHFHFMVEVIDIRGATQSRAPNINTQSRAPNINTQSRAPNINKEIGILLASYTRAINKQEKRSGSLFRKRTKAECINCPDGITPSFFNTNSGTIINNQLPERQYPQRCFDYIHRNPVTGGLVKKAVDWEFSSARDYAGMREGTLIERKVAEEYVITHGENQ